MVKEKVKTAFQLKNVFMDISLRKWFLLIAIALATQWNEENIFEISLENLDELGGVFKETKLVLSQNCISAMCSDTILFRCNGDGSSIFHTSHEIIVPECDAFNFSSSLFVKLKITLNLSSKIFYSLSMANITLNLGSYRLDIPSFELRNDKEPCNVTSCIKQSKNNVEDAELFDINSLVIFIDGILIYGRKF